MPVDQDVVSTVANFIETKQEAGVEVLPAEIRGALTEFGYDEKTVNDSIFEVFRPRITELEEKGTSRDEIVSTLVKAGFLSEAFYTDSEAGSPADTRQALEAVNTIQDPEGLQREVEETEADLAIKKAQNGAFYGGPVINFNLKLTPEEKYNGIMAMKQQFLPMVKEISAKFSNTAREELVKQKENLDADIIKRMTDDGYDVFKNPDDGNIYYRDEKGEAKLLTYNLWNILLSNKFSIPAGIAVGLKTASKLKGKGAAGVGFSLLAAGGTALLTGGLDYVGAALEAREEMNEVEAAQRMIDGAVGEVTVGAILPVVGVLAKGAYGAAKWGKAKVLENLSAVLDNPEGAWKAFMDQTGKSADQLLEIIKDVESKLGREFEGSNIQKALQAYTQYVEGGSAVVQKGALDRSKTGGAAIRQSIEKRTYDVYKAVDEISPNNPNTTFRTQLVELNRELNRGFEEIKERAVDNLTNPNYRYNFDETILKPLEEVESAVSPSPTKDRFVNYLSEIRDITQEIEAQKAAAKFSGTEDRLVKSLDEVKLEKTTADAALRKEKIKIKIAADKRAIALKAEEAEKKAEISKLDTAIRNARKAAKKNKTEKHKAAANQRLEEASQQKRRIQKSLANSKAKEQQLKNADKLKLDKMSADLLKLSDKVKAKSEVTAKQLDKADGILQSELSDIQLAKRDFTNLLKVRKAVNKFIRDTGVKKLIGDKAYAHVSAVKQSIDDEIDLVAKTNMTDGTKWLDDYRALNTEWRKFAELQQNGLYKSIMNGNPEEVISKLTTEATDPAVIRPVLQQLPPKKQMQAEGAIIQKLVESHTSNNAAIDFYSLNADLSKFEMFSKESQRIKRWINYMSDVFKSDPELYEAVKFKIKASPRDPSFSENPIGRMKMRVVMEVTDRLKMFSAAVAGKVGLERAAKMGNELALTRQMAKVLDMPLNKVEVDKFLSMLPPDHSLRNTITELQRTYARYGEYKTYKEKYISAATADGVVPTVKTNLGTGQEYFVTERNTRKIMARTNKGELVYRAIDPNDVATPEKINAEFGRIVQPSEYSSSEIQTRLKRKFDAISIGDRILVYPTK